MNKESWIILGIIIVALAIAIIYIIKNKNTCSCGKTDCSLCKRDIKKEYRREFRKKV